MCSDSCFGGRQGDSSQQGSRRHICPEADGHGPLLPKDPLLVLNIVGKHWRVVANLDEVQYMYMYISGVHRENLFWGGGGGRGRWKIN